MTDDVDVESLAVVAATRGLRAMLAELEPELMSGATCLSVAEHLARTEKACAGARLRVAARAADCGAQHLRGFARPEDWIARLAGSSAGVARDELSLGHSLEGCPETKAGLVAGDLSVAQAVEIARTEKALPDSEAELIELALSSDLAHLRDEGRRRRLAALEPDEAYRRQHRDRSFRSWTDAAGMTRFRGALTPDNGVPFVARLDARCDRLTRRAKADGNAEAREAHAADAFVALLQDACECSGADHGPGESQAEAKSTGDGESDGDDRRQTGLPAGLGGAGEAKRGEDRHGQAPGSASAGRAAHRSQPRGAARLRRGGVSRAGLWSALWVGVGPRRPGGQRRRDLRRHLQALCWPHHQDKTERDRRDWRLGPFPVRSGPPKPPERAKAPAEEEPA